MDSRTMYDTEEIRWEQIKEGDWIRPKAWSRARRVDLIEYRNGQRLVLLAEPGQMELKEVNLTGFVGRAHAGSKQDSDEVPVWYTLPTLRACWEACQAK